MVGKLQLLVAVGVALYAGFLALQSQRRGRTAKAKALAVLGVLAVLAVYVLPALIKATVLAFLTGLVLLAVLVIGGYVCLRVLQRKKRRAELT